MPAWTRLIGGWLLALIVALALSWGAVSMVRGGVIESSGTVARTVPADSETSVLSLPPTSSSSVPVDDSMTVDSIPDPTSTTSGTPAPLMPSTPATTNALTGTSSTTATSSPTSSSTSSTTSTTVSQALTTKTYPMTGGSVTISFAPGVVNFRAAVPQSGYSTDVEDVGPDRVRVEFGKDGSHSKFQAEWVSGKLAVTIED